MDNNRQDDVNTPVVATVGFLGTVAAFAIVVLLVIVYYRVYAGLEADRRATVDRQFIEVETLAVQQRGNLADFRLVDREKQVYAIPVSKAMEMIVARRREDPEGPPGIEPPDAESTADGPSDTDSSEEGEEP